ncbi:MAG: zinc-binding alcohol dehydrogenase [Armatimonadota bacterium]|nr:zinc-binding alcohol dehydrogenase [Armatimonadota bacterium]
MAIEAQAICFPEADTAELTDVIYEDPGPEELVVRMNVSGISAGTEGSIFRGIRTHNGTFPLVTGYQSVGVIEWAGDDCAPREVGERVAVTSVTSRLIEPAYDIVWGTHASRVITSPDAAHPIPEGCSDEEASLCTLYGTGMHGVNITGVEPDDTVLVIGLGLVGLSYAQWAMAVGAEIVGLDLIEDRAEVLRSLAAEAFTEQDDLQAWLDDRGLPGFSVVAQATQAGEVTDVALEFVAPGGKVVWQGWYPGRVDFYYNTAHGKQITMHFPCSTGGTQPKTLEMIAEGTFDAASLISHRFPVERCQEAYDLAVFHPEECLGVVLEWAQ